MTSEFGGLSAAFGTPRWTASLAFAAVLAGCATTAARAETGTRSTLTLGGWQTEISIAVSEPDTAVSISVGPGPAATKSAKPKGPSANALTGTQHALDGIASFYWQDQMTASGERFDKRDLTAAHRTLPFGTRVRVTRLDTGSSVVVRINDRGPFKPGRVIDLSEKAAEDIDMKGRGLVKVSLEVVDGH